MLASWAVQSRADYAIASLRKTLPLPDGGIVWSPRDLEVPPELDMTAHHAWAVAQRLSAMILKRHYLQGDDISKQDFRDVGLEGERMMASGPNTGISAFSRARLPTLPTERWRSRRAENLAEFRDALGATPGIRLLEVPFSAMLVFDDAAIRTTVRQALIAHDIYPSVLWPMDHQAVEGIPHAHVEASRRLLSLHVDHRYGTDDMRRAAAILHHAMDAG